MIHPRPVIKAWDTFSGVVRPQGVKFMGVPIPAGLSLEQIQSCESFGRLTGMTPFFDPRPTHGGRHGFTCVVCAEALTAAKAERAKRPPRQPWELAA